MWPGLALQSPPPGSAPPKSHRPTPRLAIGLWSPVHRAGVESPQGHESRAWGSARPRAALSSRQRESVSGCSRALGSRAAVRGPPVVWHFLSRVLTKCPTPHSGSRWSRSGWIVTSGKRGECRLSLCCGSLCWWPDRAASLGELSPGSPAVHPGVPPGRGCGPPATQHFLVRSCQGHRAASWACRDAGAEPQSPGQEGRCCPRGASMMRGVLSQDQGQERQRVIRPVRAA